jgi:outer membrane protein TolC
MRRAFWRATALALAAGAAGPLVTGCQTYQPAPLDPAATALAWRARSADVASLRRIEPGQPATTPAGDRGALTVTLAEAERLLLLLNPDLRVARLEAGVARASANEAGRWDDPRLALDVERILTGAASGSAAWVIGGTLNFTIPLSGRADVERRLAAAELGAAQVRVLLKEREAVADLRRVWADWSAAAGRNDVLAGAVADLTTIDASVTRLREAGELDPTEARLFTIDLVRRKTQLLASRRETRRAEADLRQRLGLTPDAPVRLVPIPADRSEAPASPAPAELHPAVLASRAAYASTERMLELEVRRQYTDLEIGGGFGRDEGESRLLGGASVPLPLFNANRRAIAEARARRDAARAEFEARLIEVESRRAAAAAEFDAAQAEVVGVERDLVPLVDRQLADARRLLDAGEFNPLVVREAIDAATEARLELLTARRALATAEAELLYLTESVAAPEAPR